MKEIKFRSLGWNKQGNYCPICHGGIIFMFDRDVKLDMRLRCGHLQRVIQNADGEFVGYFQDYKVDFEGVTYREKVDAVVERH